MQMGMSTVGAITPDWNQEQLEDYICRHSIWISRPKLEWLVGGLINRNWVVHEDKNKYVARVFFDANVQGISEQSVLACTRAASEIGVSPGLRYSEPHLTIVDFIEGRHLTEQELTDETIISGCMKLLRRLHAGTHAIRAPINYHGRFIVMRSLVKWSMENDNPHADAVRKMLPFIEKFENSMRPFRPCFTHNDLAHVNVMIEPSGKLWLIDWDFGGIGNPLSDISDLLSYGPPTDELERFALREDLDGDVSAEDVWKTAEKTYGRVAAHALAYDQQSGFGLVQALSPLGLPALELGSSGEVKVGDAGVFADGQGNSVRTSILAKQEFAGYWEYLLDEAIFTSPAHPSWGGAALIDAGGKLLGIGSLHLQVGLGEELANVNMSVPIDLLPPILDDLLAKGRVDKPPRPWLGAFFAEQNGKAVVMSVVEGGPAERAGMRAGDIISDIRDSEIEGLADFYRKLWASGPAGAEMPLRVVRDGRESWLRVRSADRNSLLKKPSLQ